LQRTLPSRKLLSARESSDETIVIRDTIRLPPHRRSWLKARNEGGFSIAYCNPFVMLFCCFSWSC